VQRGKFTGIRGKAWNDMTKKEKRKELSRRIKLFQAYVDTGEASRKSKAYLGRLRQLKEDLG